MIIGLRCGTHAGYVAHKRNKEDACEICKVGEREYKRLWRESHVQKTRVYMQTWRNEHREQRRLDARDYYSRNREAICERQRLARPFRANQAREYGKRWRQANKDLVRRKANHRRAKKLANGFEKYTEGQVLELYGSNCAICSLPIDMNAPRTCRQSGWHQGLHIDHVVPISKGGPDTLVNVRPTHAICNIRKGNNS